MSPSWTSPQEEPRRHRGWRWPLLLLVLGVALQVAAGRLPGLVEHLYAEHCYPFLVRTIRLLSGWCPVSLAELLLTALLLHLGFRGVAGLLRRRPHGVTFGMLLAGGLRRVFRWSVGLYLWYLLAWGLLHQRPDWEHRTGIPVGVPTDQEVEELALALLAEATGVRAGLPVDDQGAVRADDLAALLARAPEGYRDLPDLDRSLVDGLGAPRAAMLSPLLSLLGVTGVYVPFTGEPHVNRLVPASELPFVAAHELAHQLGVAREDEASLLAVQACRRHPDPRYRYSGAWTALRIVLGECWIRDPATYERLHAQLPAGLLADEEALRRFWSGWATPISDLGEAAREAYLRSQGTEDGTRAYDRLVHLLVAERRHQER